MPFYEASLLGQVVLHGTTYDSPSFKGSGSVRAAGTRLEATGADSAGAFIRFGKDSKAPTDAPQSGDHVCHRKP